MKYAVGDKVRVRNDLVVGNKYGDDDFVSGMKSMLGKVVTICQIDNHTYKLKEDHRLIPFNYTDEMLTSVYDLTNGDRVVGVGVVCGKNIEGKIGTVFSNATSSFGVIFDEDIGGHELGGNCDLGHGWYVSPENLNLCVNDKEEPHNWKVVIIPNGNETKGMLYNGNKIVKKVTTKKHPNDRYSEEVACETVIKRLFEVEKKPKIVKKTFYDVGDKVKIVDKWRNGCHQNLNGKMDKWLGKFMTIRTEFPFGIFDDCYFMVEDKDENSGNGWLWDKNCIEGKVVEDE